MNGVLENQTIEVQQCEVRSSLSACHDGEPTQAAKRQAITFVMQYDSAAEI